MSGSRTTCENCEAYRQNLEGACKMIEDNQRESERAIADLRTTIRAAESRNEELHRKLVNVKYELDLHVEARNARKSIAAFRKRRSLVIPGDPPFIFCCFW